MSLAPIGIFDSGVGGLTVAAGITQRLPHESLIYFGDTAHMPYGDKSEKAIQGYTLHIANFLLQSGCKALVIACNTASAVAYEVLRAALPAHIPLVSVIDPVVQAVAQSKFQHIGIIATPRTIQSQVYTEKLRQACPYAEIVAKATPSLASIIEEGMYKSPPTMNAVVAYYLNDQQFAQTEGLILGCTHYPIIRQYIAAYFAVQNRKVAIFDSTEVVAQHLEQLLQQQGLCCPPNHTPPQHRFFVSDYTRAFEQTAQIFFGQKIALQQITEKSSIHQQNTSV